MFITHNDQIVLQFFVEMWFLTKVTDPVLCFVCALPIILFKERFVDEMLSRQYPFVAC